MDLRPALWNLLSFGVFPLWLAAGAADWLCHRRSRIQHTSGPRESLLHLVLYAQVTVPLLLALFFEINALLLALLSLGVIAHMVTSWLDTRFAQPRRQISPLEQQVHSWLEMLPLFALVVVFLLHADALRSPAWDWMPRRAALPAATLTWILAAIAAGALLILEEYVRGLRARAAERVSGDWTGR